MRVELVLLAAAGLEMLHQDKQPTKRRDPAARDGFHQLVSRKGGTHVGLGLPGLRGGVRRGWVRRRTPNHTLSPFPLTHTHTSSTTALPCLEEWLGVSSSGWGSCCPRCSRQKGGFSSVTFCNYLISIEKGSSMLDVPTRRAAAAGARATARAETRRREVAEILLKQTSNDDTKAY